MPGPYFPAPQDGTISGMSGRITEVYFLAFSLTGPQWCLTAKLARGSLDRRWGGIVPRFLIVSRYRVESGTAT